jgi:ATP-dependent DNA ligase
MRAAGQRATAARLGRLCHLEVVHASDVLNDAVAAVVPDVHTEGEVRLGFLDKSHSTCPGPLLFIPHVVASRSLSRLLRALPTQPSRQATRWGWWLHEIKHDGVRMLVRRDATGVRLFTRNGHDWTGRFPLIARAALSLKTASCLIDGEAVACDNDGLPVFDRLRYRRQDGR